MVPATALLLLSFSIGILWMALDANLAQNVGWQISNYPQSQPDARLKTDEPKSMILAHVLFDETQLGGLSINQLPLAPKEI